MSIMKGRGQRGRTRFFRRYTWCVTIMALLVTGGCSMEEDLVMVHNRVVALEEKGRDMEARMARLEGRAEDMEAGLQRRGSDQDQSEKGLRDQVAQLRVSLDALREENRQVQGRLEETEHLVGTKMGAARSAGRLEGEEWNRVRESQNTLRERLARLETYVGLEAGDKASEGRDAPKKAEGSLPADQLYAKGKDAYDRGDFETARQQLSAFLARFPESKDADNALFWIGDSYYSEKWYEKAIIEYQKVMEKYPKGNKVPAALLKQAMAFAMLKDDKNARLVMTELISKYPDAPESKIAKSKLDSLKASQ